MINNNEMDLTIINGTLVLETGTILANLSIKDGKIESITSTNTQLPAKKIIDAKDLLVFPGLVDPHIHFKEPGPGNVRENFYNGTCQAVVGGVTTSVEMPLSQPLVTDKSAFDLKRKVADSQVVNDYALWGLLPAHNLENIDELIDCGAVAFKAFMSTDPDAPKLTEYLLLQAMQTMKDHNRFIGFHAENGDIIDNTIEALQKTGEKGGLAHLKSRPDIAEMEAISKISLFAEVTGCDIHICHLSSAKARDIIKHARSRNVSMTVETCPSYLVLDETDLEKGGVFAKCNPPIREKANQEILWDMLFSGEINMIGSDHCPYTDEDRLKHNGDIWAVPPGLPGIELMLPIMLDAGLNKRNMPAEMIAKIMCSNPAKRFGLSHKKGSIRIGADADIVLADPNAAWTYYGKDSKSMHKSSLTPWEGKTFKGKVVSTIVRGVTVYNEGKVLVDPGFGEFVSPVF